MRAKTDVPMRARRQSPRSTIRGALRCAQKLVAEWYGIAIEGHRMGNGAIKWNADTRADIEPWGRALARIEAAQRAMDIMPPAPSRGTIRRGLVAAMALAKEYREAIVRGYADPEDEPDRNFPECRRSVRPVDRTIGKIQAALDATALMSPAPTVSRELRRLIAEADRMRSEHFAAVDRFDMAWSEARECCPAPAFIGGPVSAKDALALAEDAELSPDERGEAAAYARRLAAAEADLDVPTLDAASGTTAAAYNEAETAVIAFPARSIADVLAKLRYAAAQGYFDHCEDIGRMRLIEDLGRLTGCRTDVADPSRSKSQRTKP